MRILYVISGLGFGGAEKQLIELAKELSSRGHEVAIYTLTRHVPRAMDLAGSGVTLIVDQKGRKFDVRVLWRLRSLFERWRPDIVQGFLFDGDFYSRVAALRTGIPVLNSERSDRYRLSPIKGFAHRLTRRYACGVVANTYSGAAFAQRMFGLASDNVHVVWNGIRVENLERHAAATAEYRSEFFGGGDVRVACLVGSIRPAKDYHLALDSAAQLIGLDPAWRVLLVGDQPPSPGTYYGRDARDTSHYKTEVLAHYERLGLAEKIKFCGLRTDVSAILSQSDVVYVTSVYEGFPNAVLEAMALGVPVVSTEYSDIRRILPFPQQVIGSRNAEDVARAVMWAHERHDMIALRQKEWVETHATIERAATQLERIYLKYIRPDSAPKTCEPSSSISAVACAAPQQTERDG